MIKSIHFVPLSLLILCLSTSTVLHICQSILSLMWCVVSLEGQYIPPQQQIRRDNKWRRQMWKQLIWHERRNLTLVAAAAAKAIVGRGNRSVSQLVRMGGVYMKIRHPAMIEAKFGSTEKDIGGCGWIDLVARPKWQIPTRQTEWFITCLYLFIGVFFSFRTPPTKMLWNEYNIFEATNRAEEKSVILSLPFVCLSNTLFLE